MKTTFIYEPENVSVNWDKIQVVKFKHASIFVLTTGVQSDDSFEGIVLHSSEEVLTMYTDFRKSDYEPIESCLTVNFIP